MSVINKILSPFRVEIVIVIKGTTSYAEVMTDIDIWLVDSPFGYIHRGFYHLFREIYPSIYRVLVTLPATTQLVLTGHSLGAAFNTILAVASPLMPRRIISFASPMVGGKDFYYNYIKVQSCTQRFVNYQDIIPKTPIILAYRHVCPAITFIDGDLDDIVHNHKMSTYAIHC